MSPFDAEAKRLVQPILASQLFAVLATRDAHGLHTSLMAFAAGEDCLRVYFATPVNSRKFTNLTSYASVSLLVDDRVNKAESLVDITCISIRGDARVVEPQSQAEALAVYTGKHPTMRAFAEKPDTALVEVCVAQYDVVTRFQRVSTFVVV